MTVIPAGTDDEIERGLGISRRTHRDIATLVAALAHVKIPTRPVDVVQVWAGEHSDGTIGRSEEHTSELQSRGHLVCRLLREKKNTSMGAFLHSTGADG